MVKSEFLFLKAFATLFFTHDLCWLDGKHKPLQIREPLDINSVRVGEIIVMLVSRWFLLNIPLPYSSLIQTLHIQLT